MADPAGRKWLYNHLATLHVFTTSFASNALVMAHAEGERNAGLRLVADMAEANPDMYLQMLKEMYSERSAPVAGGDPADPTDISGDSSAGADEYTRYSGG